jgi:hypothetical protein
VPSKWQIFDWIHSILPSAERCLTIESLGNGVVYCRIVNHYAPGSIHASRITPSPLNNYENCINLKQLQQALGKLRINVPFDISKVSKQRFNENWNLIVLLYRQLEGADFRKEQEERVVTVAPKRCHFELPMYEQEHVLEERREKNDQAKGPNLEIFQKGGLAFMVDRVKEILIGNYNDTYKIQLIRKLFSLEEAVKLEENQDPIQLSTCKANPSSLR